MSDGRLQAQRIITLTAAIEDAREALRVDDTPTSRERLAAAEADYKQYLISLNGLDDTRWPSPPW